MRTRRTAVASAVATVATAAALVFAAGIAAAGEPFAPGVAADGAISVPAVDYRKDWAYLGTFSVAGEDGAAELHVVYTQPETVAAYRANGAFPDGAVLVKELHATATTDLTTGRVSYADAPAGWFVMIKDTEGRFPENPLWGDGWGWAFFEADAPQRTTSEDYRTDCLGCHEPARATDLTYVQGYPSLRGPAR